MYPNNNIWELAETYLAGTLSENEQTDLKVRLESDTVFAGEFYESLNLLNSIGNSGKQQRFREMLRDIHTKQQQQLPLEKGKRILLNRHVWRTIGIAASVAILTSTLTMWSIKPYMNRSDKQYVRISREVDVIKKVQEQQQFEQTKLQQDIDNNIKPALPAPPAADARFTGTGFALTNDGYFVTSNHVIHYDEKSEPDSVYILNNDGQYFKAFLVAYNTASDIAIMKVEKKNFHFSKSELPYTFANVRAMLGEDIFTLGCPNDEPIYSKGYISSNNGFGGDDQQYTLQLPAGHGQSGSPVLDANGSIIGILTAIGGVGESAANATNTYAVNSKSLLSLIENNMPEESNLHLPKVNKLQNLTRTEQIEKIEPFTFSVKVYKK